VTPTHELVILETEQWVGRVEELRVKDDFDAVMYAVEEIAATDTGHRKKKKIQFR
jgi:hypothetical protein